jgi:PAS domain S-box-containing protein
MEKQKSSKPLRLSGKGKTSSDEKLRQSANPKRKKAEEEIERFASFLKLNPNPVLEVDSSGRIVFYNDAAAAVLKKFSLSKKISIFLPDDIKEILTGLKKKKEGQFHRELIIKGKVFEETIYLVPQFNTLRIYAVDITERKQTETALQVSESKYHSLFAKMISGFAYNQIVLNRNGKPVDYIFLEINDAFEKLTRLKREDIIGKGATEIIPGIENDPADWIGTYGKVALTGKDTTFENYSETLKKWFSVSAFCPQNGYFVTIFDDITERKRAEGALRDSNKRYELVMSGAEAGIWDWDVTRHKVVFSPRWKTMRGFAEHEVSDAEEEWSREIHPEDAPRVMAAVQAHFKGKTPFFAEEYRVRCKDGSWIWIADRGIAQRDAHGKVIRMAGSESDITKRKLAEEALRKSEERLRLSQQAAHVGTFDWDIRTNVNIWTPELEAMYGLQPGEFVKTQAGWEQLIHPDDRDEAVRRVELAFRTEQPVEGEWRVIWPDGSVHWITGRWQVFKDKAGKPLRMTGVNLEITGRKQKEEELRRLNRTLMALGKSSKAMMHATNESEYLDEVCRIIVEDCGHAMVWIGFAEDDAAKTVRPVAYAGFEKGYIETLKITWADTPRGRGPTGTAIRTGQPSICRNMQTDPLFKPWREEAIKRGYASSIVLPLMDSSKAIGAINIYAREPDPFTKDEITLLSELADDLSYGISSIRLKAAHDRTAEAVRQSEERYRSLVEVSPDAVFVNRGDQIVFANPAALHLFGATGAEQVLGRSPFEMFEPDYHPIMRKRIETLLGGESVPLIEGRIIRLDDTMRDVEIAAAPFNDSAGRAIQVILRDITERKRAEEALRKANEELESKVRERTGELNKAYESVESERQRLYSVLDKLPAYVCLLTADYKFAYVNRKFKRLFGDPGDRQCYEYLFGLRKPCEGCQTFRIFGENLSVHHWEWTGPNGKTYAVSDYPFIDIDGSPLILEMGIDITEQRRAAKALEESEHKYRMLVEQAADGIVLLDRKLNIVDINKAACEMTGFTCEELLKLNAKDLYPQDELEERPLRLDEVLSGATVTAERRAAKKDGSLIEVEISAKLIEVGHIQAIVRDITERKNEERRNHLTTDLLELFARAATRKSYLDSVVELLHKWTGCRSVGIRVVNKERYVPYDSYTGFSEEFMRKENMISLDCDACACIRVIKGKFEPQDAPVITPNGSFRLEDSIQFANGLTEKELSRFRGNCIRSGYVSIAVIPIQYHDQPLGAIHLADEKKNMVTSDVIQFLESMAAPLIGEAIYRFSAEEELTRHRHHLEEIVKERTRELHDIQTDLNRAQTVAHIGSWRLDVRQNELLWSDENWRIFGVPKGTALTYETFLSTIHPDDREYVDKQWRAALQGVPYDIEHRIIVDGQVKWVREKAELEFETDSILKGGFGTTEDITEKKQAERDLQTLMEELKRSNSDLEQFAYAASHDLQEPLRVVAGFVSLLEKKYKEKLDEKAHEYIEYSVDGVKRMQVLIKDLLAYSQVGTKGKTFKLTYCSVALEQSIYNLHAAVEESGAEITYDSLPTVLADSSQLTRLFQNLIGNAIKFRGEERLQIHIAAEQKGNEWVFSVRDNGIGIDPKFFGRIFVVFQRLHTREEYEGTGIGLAVCKKIVERHGGRIWVESEQGKGTTFYFTMPVME